MLLNHIGNVEDVFLSFFSAPRGGNLTDKNFALQRTLILSSLLWATRTFDVMLTRSTKCLCDAQVAALLIDLSLEFES